jgi:hypothetical protein
MFGLIFFYIEDKILDFQKKTLFDNTFKNHDEMQKMIYRTAMAYLLKQTHLYSYKATKYCHVSTHRQGGEFITGRFTRPRSPEIYYGCDNGFRGLIFCCAAL